MWRLPRMNWRIVALVACLVGAVGSIGFALGADSAPAEPSTCLFDTGATSQQPLAAAELKARSGWTQVPEDNVAHKFQGDALVLNDRLIVVLRTKGAAAEIYSQTPAGPNLRVSLTAASSTGAAQALAPARIVENNSGAVVLGATFRTADSTCAATFRLSAGQPFVEARPGAGTDRLVIQQKTRYLVVPDFFGDDMVFASPLPRPRLRLPTENFLLGLVGETGGDRGITMCVWASSQQEATARVSAASDTIDAFELQAIQDKSVWIACLEGENVWHPRPIEAKDAQAELALDWRTPFAAKWRGDLVDAHRATSSWYFSSRDEAGESAQGGGRSSPCCLTGDRATVRVATGGLSAPGFPALMLVYPMDRTRTTPLTTFTPMDILRNTLGVGPCQYILQTEGLSSEDNPTPDNVMTWVEKQFSRKKEKKAAGEIRERLAKMVEHLEHAQARIEQYRGWAADVRSATAQAAGLQRLQPIAGELEQAAKPGEGPAVAVRARQLADAVLQLIDKDGAAAECERLGNQLREAGGQQDRAMANCRMKARWLRQSARMLAEDQPSNATAVEPVVARTEQVLRGKAK